MKDKVFIILYYSDAYEVLATKLPEDLFHAILLGLRDCDSLKLAISLLHVKVQDW